MPDALTNEKKTVGPRTTYARNAFVNHWGYEPSSNNQWVAGYLAALEDLPDEALASLGLR